MLDLKHGACLACLFTCLISAALAKEKPFILERRAWRAAVETHTGDGPPLLIVHPIRGRGYSGGKVFYTGCTVPGAVMTLNGQEIPLEPNGAFAGLLELPSGAHSLRFVASLGEKETRETVSLKMQSWGEARPVPETPLQIDPRRPMEPGTSLLLREGDSFRVRFQGSPGGRAWFQIGMGKTRYPMVELQPGKDDVVIPGVYEGVLTIRPSHNYVKAPVHGFLEKNGGAKIETVSQILPGLLSTHPRYVGRWLSTCRSDTGLYVDASASWRMTSVPRNTLLYRDGKRGNMTRALLGGWRHVWLRDSYMRLLPVEKSGPEVQLKRIVPGEDRMGNLELRFSLEWSGADASERQCPIEAMVEEEGNRLGLILYGVEGEALALSRDQASTHSLSFLLPQLLESFRILPLGRQSLMVQVEPDSDRLWGYDWRFEDGDLVLWLKKPPRFSVYEESPLKGLRIFLDPGHGGSDTGAVGPAGLYESDINLAIALALRKRLEQAGADVVLSREADRYISLENRIAQVYAAEADLFLSLHNNSIPSWKNPREAKGPLFFYYHQHDQTLAKALYQNLCESIDFPAQERAVQPHFFRPLRRCPLLPTALAETQFMCNPDEERRLLNPAFLDKMVEGLYKGFLDYGRVVLPKKEKAVWMPALQEQMEMAEKEIAPKRVFENHDGGKKPLPLPTPRRSHIRAAPMKTRVR